MFKSLVPAAAALLMSSSAFAETSVSSVDVTVDLTAIKNESAAAYYTSIEEDLETAIVAKLTDQLSDDGASVVVDIDELSLANSFQSVLGLEESELAGSVSVNNLNDNSEHQAYELTVSYLPAPIVFDPGEDIVIIRRDTTDYYIQMVDTFAEHLTEKLK
ncbi:hypothetical protein SAMN05444273_103193 [Litoreibacter ascidiaceicola]|uniref:DUF302 domain-containing protein n=1 Tax=Litoreibacter ascidiaceicola TaxID=1486859 RepID=A0A1M4XIP9_9RHOB|nr:hypothetical protein [Litoreibacter ascidiaceicola]SHE93385.1 hypothetical protein SAMN05444273_103193 [Litoreibacter ascidiaceicola]